MDRRALIKACSLALLSPAAAVCARQASSPDGKMRTLKIAFHGPALLMFPEDGTRARLHFVAFHGNVCKLPLHLPRLILRNREAARCVSRPDEFSWSFAGLDATPDVQEGSLSAPDFRMRAEPTDRPPRWTDWSSLKWVPKLEGAIDSQKLQAFTVASVDMHAGTLQGFRPHYEDGVRRLWTWQTKDAWNKLSPKERQNAHRNPMTDQLLYSTPFTGRSVRLWLNPVLAPESRFSLEFETDSDEVCLSFTSEAPGDMEDGPTMPMLLPCGYYDFLEQPPSDAARALPYGIEVANVSPEKLKALESQDPCFGKLVQSATVSPKPSCGQMRMIGGYRPVRPIANPPV